MEKIPDELDNKFEELAIVRKYFSRFFTVLSREIREKVINLNISEKVKKILLKELAFLTEEKQKEYLDELGKL